MWQTQQPWLFFKSTSRWFQNVELQWTVSKLIEMRKASLIRSIYSLMFRFCFDQHGTVMLFCNFDVVGLCFFNILMWVKISNSLSNFESFLKLCWWAGTGLPADSGGSTESLQGNSASKAPSFEHRVCRDTGWHSGNLMDFLLIGCLLIRLE
jgi:hypothetical protein